MRNRFGLQAAALMVAASLGMGSTFQHPQPEPDPRQSRRRRRGTASIILDGVTGDVSHTFTEKPLTKRQKRRLRGRKDTPNG